MNYDEDDSKMISYKARLNTFKTWPYTDECSCTPEKVKTKPFIYLF
jgi:hypothetical protein